MPSCTANGIKLTFDRAGDPEAPALVLIMGFSMQLTAWPTPFRDALVDAGFQVIRFDNRDMGLSERLDALGQPPIPRLLARRIAGLRVRAPYTLADMAADTCALLDVLGIERAHVVGASMGGMIAQRLAIDHPRRVRSLTSIMSTTGALRFGLPRPRVLRLLLTPPPGPDLDARIGYGLRFWRAVASPGDPPSDAELEADVRAWYERAPDLSGRERQLAAIIAQRDRSRELGRVRTPALVIHGSSDPLVPCSGGRATARALPGARFVPLAGMGHDLRPRYLPRLAEEIVAHARSADGRAGRRAP